MTEGQYTIIISCLLTLETGLHPCMHFIEILHPLLAWLSCISGLKTYSKKTMKQIGEAGLRMQEYGNLFALSCADKY